METFDFFFGVELGRIVLNMADNLLNALQESTVAVSDGQSLMNMTVAFIQSTRSEELFTASGKRLKQNVNIAILKL